MVRIARCLLALGVCATAERATAQAPDGATTVVERTATAHPMRYLVSLPSGWNAQRKWPLVVVITGADREFQKTAKTFSDVRGSMPFVIVVPLELTGGGTAQQHKTDFDYPDAAWALADRVGNCSFDEDGMTAVLADLRRLYSTASQLFITGWEAGGHMIIAQLFQHPERVRAAVLVTPNFISRCITPAARPVTKTESLIPVEVFHGQNDTPWTSANPLFVQWTRFDSVARQRGFGGVRDSVIKNAGHGALAANVLSYFASLLTR